MRKVLIWGIAATIAVVGAAAIWGWAGGKGDGWWGATGQWLGALASLAAAAIALWIADSGRRDNERIQARLIFGEYEPREGLTGYVRVRNRSGGFILDPTIVGLSVHHSYGKGEWAVGTLDHLATASLPHQIVNDVEPLRSTDALTVFFKTDGAASAISGEVEPVVTINFIDSDGREWTRRGREEPVRRIPKR
jgi:hypothetical protein